MQQTVNQRIKIIRKLVKLSQTEFATRIGLSQSRVSQVELEEDTGVKDDMLRSICNEFKISAEWLLNGKGPMEKNKASQERGEEEKGILYVPVKAQAGFTSELVDHDHGDGLSRITGIPGFELCEVALFIEGDSMYPTYANGDIVLCRRIPISKDRTPIRWGEPYLIATLDKPVVKYIHEEKGDYLLAVSENPLYHPYRIHKKDIRGLWSVEGSISKSQRRRTTMDEALKELISKVDQLLKQKEKK